MPNPPAPVILLNPHSFAWWTSEVRRLSEWCQVLFAAAVEAGADPVKLLALVNRENRDAE